MKVVYVYYDDLYAQNIVLINRKVCNTIESVVDTISDLSNITVKIISEYYEVCFSKSEEKFKFRNFLSKFDSDEFNTPRNLEEFLRAIEYESFSQKEDCTLDFNSGVTVKFFPGDILED